jgi:large subunit ribosomal protein L35
MASAEKAPKMKTKRGAKKRLSVTGTGLVKHKAKGRRHKFSNKSRKRKRQLRRAGILFSGDNRIVERLIPYL